MKFQGGSTGFQRDSMDGVSAFQGSSRSSQGISEDASDNKVRKISVEFQGHSREF